MPNDNNQNLVPPNIGLFHNKRSIEDQYKDLSPLEKRPEYFDFPSLNCRKVNNAKSILLHTCCAPCSGSIAMQLIGLFPTNKNKEDQNTDLCLPEKRPNAGIPKYFKETSTASNFNFRKSSTDFLSSFNCTKVSKDSGITCTLFFYNPNIHPQDEHEMRKKEHIYFAQKLDIPFIDADYDTDKWFERVKGLEKEPERGKRCTACFDIRLERTALFAYENNFPVFATTLGMSRWKDINQVNECGRNAAAKYPNLIYWDHNWRKHGGSQAMYEVAKQEKFYKQEYCGCTYSLRDTNLWRTKKGKPKITTNTQFYSNPTN